MSKSIPEVTLLILVWFILTLLFSWMLMIALNFIFTLFDYSMHLTFWQSYGLFWAILIIRMVLFGGKSRS